jgi:hypothetical protein
VSTGVQRRSPPRHPRIHLEVPAASGRPDGRCPPSPARTVGLARPGARHRHVQSEGWGRQDDDDDQPRSRAGRGRSQGAARRLRPTGRPVGRAGGQRPNDLDVTIYNLLTERGHDIRDVIQQTRGAEGWISSRPTSTCRRRRCSWSARWPASRSCARVLRPVMDDYDVVMIDCQPSLGLLTVNALTAAHGVIIPLECEFFAMRGVALLVETIEKITDRLNPRLQIDGILATMYDGRTLHSREVVRVGRRPLRRPGLPHGHQPHGEVPGRDPGGRADHHLCLRHHGAAAHTGSWRAS